VTVDPVYIGRVRLTINLSVGRSAERPYAYTGLNANFRVIYGEYRNNFITTVQYDRHKHHRRSTRLQGWDYSRPGAYFITINIKGHVCFFGKVKNNKVILSNVGNVARDNLISIPEYFPHVLLDQFVVMPNHVHVIVFIERPFESLSKGVPSERPIEEKVNKAEYYRTISPKKGSVSVIFRRYKESVKKWCNDNGYGDFTWQSRFNDRVIRSNEELKRIRKYIIDNPRNWDIDENNPLNVRRV
jgi:putative transposase